MPDQMRSTPAGAPIWTRVIGRSRVVALCPQVAVVHRVAGLRLACPIWVVTLPEPVGSIGEPA